MHAILLGEERRETWRTTEISEAGCVLDGVGSLGPLRFDLASERSAFAVSLGNALALFDRGLAGKIVL